MLLAALFMREKAGRGSWFEVPLAASALKIGETRLVEYDEQGQPAKAAMMSRGGYDTFRCRDGAWIAVGCIEDRFWSRLCTAIGRADLLDDRRLTSYADRCANSDFVNSRLAATFLSADRAHWLDLFTNSDLPVNAVVDFASIGDDVQMRRWIHEGTGGRRVSLPYDYREYLKERGN
jgi:formyl-CoA transferase